MKNRADIFKITCGVCLVLILCSVGPSDSNTRWQELPPTLPVDVNSEDTVYLRSAVQQSAMSAEQRDFQKIGDNQGISKLDPNSAEHTDLTGLWVGYVVIDRVSQSADANESCEPSPTGSEFQFPLILHVDANDNVYLLREIVQPRGRRISSAAFSFPKPIKMQPVSGSFGFEGAVFTQEIVIDENDPLNPFRHKFHPDHDGLDERGQIEIYQITRTLKLEFTSKVPGVSRTVGWWDTDIGGIYKEVLTVLHKLPIHVQGTFRLHRISQIGELNDGR